MSFIRQPSIGHYEDLVANRDLVLATCPSSHRRRILGLAPRYRPVKTHEITVDLRTGERQVVASKRPVADAPQVNPVCHSPLPPEARQVEVCAATGRRESARQIIDAVSDVWGVSVVELHSNGKIQRVGRPRFACFLLLRSRLQFSSPKIGRILGGRDHSTVLAGIRRARWLYEHDADWRAKFDAAVAALDGGAK